MLKEESLMTYWVHGSFSEFYLVDLVIIHLPFGSQSFLVVAQKIDLFLSKMASFVLASDGDHVDILSFELYQKVVSIAKSIIFVNKDRFVLHFFLYGEDNFFVHPKELWEKLRVVLIRTILIMLIPKLQGSKSSEVIVVKGRLILVFILDNNKSVF